MIVRLMGLLVKHAKLLPKELALQTVVVFLVISIMEFFAKVIFVSYVRN